MAKGSPEKRPRSPEEPGEEIIAALQTADPAKGEQDVALCKVCHSFDKGGANLVGPNLYGIVGTKIAEARGGFNFTPALKKHEGADWTFQNLDLWLTNPQAFASGTTMAFPGIPDLKKRADVIAYLNKNSDSPLPIPKPKPKEEAPAGGSPKPAVRSRRAAPIWLAFLAAVAAADPKKGESDAMLCKVCHTFDKGGAALVGPNLYGIVGDPIAEPRGLQFHAGPQEARRRQVDLRQPGRMADQPASLCARNDDGVPRHCGREEAGRGGRLATHRRRQPGAVA